MFIKLLASIGAVWIIKDSYILSTPRDYLKSKSKHLDKFLSCSLCLGFWVGLFFCFIENNFLLKFDIKYIYYPLATSAFCWVLDSLLDLIQEFSVSLENKNK